MLYVSGKNINTFRSNQTKVCHTIHMPYHYMQKSMDYLLARMYQYVGKSENSFNIRLNNHRKDVSTPKATPACAQVCHYIFLMGHFS